MQPGRHNFLFWFVCKVDWNRRWSSAELCRRVIRLCRVFDLRTSNAPDERQLPSSDSVFPTANLTNVLLIGTNDQAIQSWQTSIWHLSLHSQFWAIVSMSFFFSYHAQLGGTGTPKWISKIWMPAPDVERLVRERLTISWRAPPLTFNNFSTIA